VSDEPDLLKNIKNIAYTRAFGEPGKKLTLSGLVEVAKLFLCRETRTLWKDPIWESYSDEDVLVEYFCCRFSEEDEEFKDAFLRSIGQYSSEIDEFAEWANGQEDKLEEEIAEQEDDVSFSPKDLK